MEWSTDTKTGYDDLEVYIEHGYVIVSSTGRNNVKMAAFSFNLLGFSYWLIAVLLYEQIIWWKLRLKSQISLKFDHGKERWGSTKWYNCANVSPEYWTDLKCHPAKQ